MPSFTSQRQTLAFFCAVVLCVSFVSLGECQTTTPPPTPCSAYKNCDTCAPNPKCLWCFTNNNCTEYPVSWLLPPSSVCKLSEARWGVCWRELI
ncbi:pituitary tumor-transforming gene 1 protein-interacting protein-like, partial [Plectropomus leopardus]|uniref:pituitary tumor-transforming gene 1 protein-interacting protein-like n=1 Tax=Plectropomus leopardus TaxID=160734 RepID=UPI001C4B65EA